MGTYAIVESGVVVNFVEWDGVPYTPALPPGESGEGGTPATGWSPPEGSQAVEIPEGSEAGIGWTYDGSMFTAPPPPPPPVVSPEQILARNTSTRDAFLSQAATALAPLQMAVALGEATDEETAQAKVWVAFSRAVKAVDLTQASPAWPTAPGGSS